MEDRRHLLRAQHHALALIKMADTLIPAYRDAYEKRGQSMYQASNDYGFEPSRVMRGANLEDFNNMSEDEIDSIFAAIDDAAASPTGSGSVPVEAATEFLRNIQGLSGEALQREIAEFEAEFPGMARGLMNGPR